MTRATCAWCRLPGNVENMLTTYERGPDGPVEVLIHDDCIDDWNDRTDPLAGNKGSER